MLSYFEIVSRKTPPPGWIWVRDIKWLNFIGSSWNFPVFWNFDPSKTPNPMVGWGLIFFIDFRGSWWHFPYFWILDPVKTSLGSVKFVEVPMNMHAKFCRGPMVVSEKKGGVQTDTRTLTNYRKTVLQSQNFQHCETENATHPKDVCVTLSLQCTCPEERHHLFDPLPQILTVLACSSLQGHHTTSLIHSSRLLHCLPAAAYNAITNKMWDKL